MEPAAKKIKIETVGRTSSITAQPSFIEVLERLSELEDDRGSESEDRADVWARPTLPTLNPNTETFTFQQIEIEEHQEPNHATSLQMFGVTEGGHSVLAHVTGFQPYFYAVSPRGLEGSDLDSLTIALNNELQNPSVLCTEIVLKHFSLYRGAPKARFVKVTVQDQQGLSDTRDEYYSYAVYGFRFRTLRFNKVTYEHDIPFILRFMVDTKTVGMSWIEVPAGAYRMASNKTSHCQIEFSMRWDAFISHKPEGRWATLAPLRVLSFDVECRIRGDKFPEADTDPVLQIANMVTRRGESKPFVRNVFTLDTCAEIVGAQVFEHKNELEMLIAWREFVEKVDPDLVIGYNIANFDLPYLLDRAKALQGDAFPYLGRLKGVKSQVKTTQFPNKTLGNQNAKETNLSGRLQLDIFQFMKREHELQNYKLKAVSAEFLGQQKEDVEISMITKLQDGTAESRRRLAIYCLKDAYLPQELMEKTMCLDHYAERARATGVPFNYILPRGKPIMDLSQRYHEANNKNYLVLR